VNCSGRRGRIYERKWTKLRSLERAGKRGQKVERKRWWEKARESALKLFCSQHFSSLFLNCLSLLIDWLMSDFPLLLLVTVLVF